MKTSLLLIFTVFSLASAKESISSLINHNDDRHSVSFASPTSVEITFIPAVDIFFAKHSFIKIHYSIDNGSLFTNTMSMSQDSGTHTITGLTAESIITYNFEYGKTLKKSYETENATYYFTGEPPFVKTRVQWLGAFSELPGTIELEVGDVWFNTTEGHSYIFDIDSTWSFFAMGTQGLQGTPGVDGQNGVQGSQGPTGAVSTACNETITILNDVIQKLTPSQSSGATASINPPTVASTDFSVPENAPIGSAIGSFIATDADGDLLTFTITNGNSDNRFTITNGGTIMLNNTLDYETTQNYVLTVSVSDGKYEKMANATITIQNANDLPELTSVTTFEIDENSPLETIVGQLDATDSDGDALTFSTTHSTHFSLSTTGKIKVLAPLNYEEQSTYTLPITIHDGQGTTLVSIIISIHNLIDDCNDLSFDSATQLCDNRDLTLYKKITIGAQTWMAENLAYTPVEEQFSSTYCSTDPTQCEASGRYYPWVTALQGSTEESTQGICPEGWHIPSSSEWDILSSVVSNSGIVDGTALKSSTLWYNNLNGINSSGMSVYPFGFFNPSTNTVSSVSQHSFIWTSSQYNGEYAYSRNLTTQDKVNRTMHQKSNGFSVRCIIN